MLFFLNKLCFNGVQWNFITCFFYHDWVLLIPTLNNLQVLGSVLYTFFVYDFFLGALILFLVMVGCIFLTENVQNYKKKKMVRNQSIFLQHFKKSSLNYFKKT